MLPRRGRRRRRRAHQGQAIATFILRLDPQPGTGPRLAVKDLIDIAGTPTTAGSAVVAASAVPAIADAPCLAGARAAGARIVGKANLSELAFLPTGTNPHFGTPVNPLDPRLIPGGSSSGSAVAVATDEADIAFGSDTGGSIRIPAACCGIVGLKTTQGRVSLERVWPLSPSFDSLGPLATTVDGVTAGMTLLEPGFTPAVRVAPRVGRIRCPGADPLLDAAVDDALARAEFEVADVELPDLVDVGARQLSIQEPEAFELHGHLLATGGLDPFVAGRLERGRAVDPADRAQAWEDRRRWQERLSGLFDRYGCLALPTMPTFPPTIEASPRAPLTAFTRPFSFAGTPALSLPVPAAAPLPASLQLAGPAGSEEMLVALARRVESAVAG